MNKVMLIGNVGRDPEVRYVDQGQAVARLTMATTERGYTLQNGTQVPERTEWHNVILWRKLAEIVERYVHKGDKIYIEGRIHYASYDDKQGKRQFYTEIWADNMELLSPKPAGQGNGAPSAAAVPSAGSNPTGNAPTGSAPTGNAPTGSAPTGNAPTGNAQAGDTSASANNFSANDNEELPF